MNSTDAQSKSEIIREKKVKEFLERYNNLSTSLAFDDFEKEANLLGIRRIFISKQDFETAILCEDFTFQHLVRREIKLGEKIILQIYPHLPTTSKRIRLVRWVIDIKPVIPLLQDEDIINLTVSTINKASL